MEKNKVNVKINKTDYTLVTGEEPEYVQRVAILVDKKISEITANNPHLSTAMSAMLTAINIADDYLKNEDSADNLRTEFSDYSKKLKELGNELEEKNKEIQKLEKEVQELKISLAKFEGARNERKNH